MADRFRVTAPVTICLGWLPWLGAGLCLFVLTWATQQL